MATGHITSTHGNPGGSVYGNPDGLVFKSNIDPAFTSDLLYRILISSNDTSNLGPLALADFNIPGYTYQYDSSQLVAPINLPVDFLNNSTNATSWLWNFGDGATSTLQNPTHTYTTIGTYTVSLTATNSWGDANTTNTGAVWAVSNVHPNPTFTVSATTGVDPTSITLTDITVAWPNNRQWLMPTGSIDGATAWTQTFNDPKTLNLSFPLGIYEVWMFFVNQYFPTRYITFPGIQQYTSVTITPQPAAPVAAFTYTPTSGITPLLVSFTDTTDTTSFHAPTAWAWDFGDGATSILQHPTHTYTTAGTFTTSLTASNAIGGNSISHTVTTTAPVMPVASFTFSPSSGTVPLTVNFNDTSTGIPTSWAWDFDNNGSTDSTAQNPLNTYSTAGTYSVKLTATNSNGSNTYIGTNIITVTGGSSTTTDFFNFEDIGATVTDSAGVAPGAYFSSYGLTFSACYAISTVYPTLGGAAWAFSPDRSGGGNAFISNTDTSTFNTSFTITTNANSPYNVANSSYGSAPSTITMDLYHISTNNITVLITDSTSSNVLQYFNGHFAYGVTGWLSISIDTSSLSDIKTIQISAASAGIWFGIDNLTFVP
jgi:PKD repeat protein